MMQDECFICHAKALPHPDSVQVNPCDRCEQYVCGNHAEYDYSYEGDHYVMTQWSCENRIECQGETI